MSWIMCDNEYYKITLEIIEDFINFDFLGFLKKGFNPENKKITWEMTIFFKLLDGQNQRIIDYYLTDFKNAIEEKLNKYKYFGPGDNQTSKYCIQCVMAENKSHNGCNNNDYIETEIQECKNLALLKIKFFCFEIKYVSFEKNAILSDYLNNHDSMRKINYISLLFLMIHNILIEFNVSSYKKNLKIPGNISYCNPYLYEIDDYSLIVRKLNSMAIVHWEENYKIFESIINYYNNKFDEIFTILYFKQLQEACLIDSIRKFYNFHEWAQTYEEN